jgi:hypothetical protein
MNKKELLKDIKEEERIEREMIRDNPLLQYSTTQLKAELRRRKRRGLDDKTSTVLLPDIDVEVEVHKIPVECALPQTVVEKIKETLR